MMERALLVIFGGGIFILSVYVGKERSGKENSFSGIVHDELNSDVVVCLIFEEFDVDWGSDGSCSKFTVFTLL